MANSSFRTSPMEFLRSVEAVLAVSETPLVTRSSIDALRRRSPERQARNDDRRDDAHDRFTGSLREQSWAALTIMFRGLHRRAYRTARGSP